MVDVVIKQPMYKNPCGLLSHIPSKVFCFQQWTRIFTILKEIIWHSYITDFLPDCELQPRCPNAGNGICQSGYLTKYSQNALTNIYANQPLLRHLLTCSLGAGHRHASWRLDPSLLWLSALMESSVAWSGMPPSTIKSTTASANSIMLASNIYAYILNSKYK